VRRYAVFAASILISAGLGFSLGRAYPARRYQQFGQSRYLFDRSKGRLCDPVSSGGNSAGVSAKPTALDSVRAQLQQPTDNQDQADIFSRRAQILKDSEASATPPCGKE
jgi:hypothetical protein